MAATIDHICINLLVPSAQKINIKNPGDQVNIGGVKKNKPRAGHSLYLPGGTLTSTWQAHICMSPPRARTHDRRIGRPVL